MRSFSGNNRNNYVRFIEKIEPGMKEENEKDGPDGPPIAEYTNMPPRGHEKFGYANDYDINTAFFYYTYYSPYNVNISLSIPTNNNGVALLL